MSVTVFATAFLVMIAGMLVFIYINTNTLPVVKAGKATKICSKSRRIFGYMPDIIRVNGVKIDLSEDEKMCVSGNSMKDYRIYDGQRIYVKTIKAEDKNSITKYPVLVFDIVNNPHADDAQFKLRKFVGYVKTDNWGEVFDSYHSRIRIGKKDFIAQCVVKYEKTPQGDRSNLILSETFDEDTEKIVYSLHPANTVYGKVEYAL